MDAPGAKKKSKSGKDTGQAFDPAALSATLKSNLFNRYVSFTLAIEEVPSSCFMSWCEGCDCHEPLIKGLSDYRRAKLFRAHYGDAFTTCPAAGMRAPHLAAGRHMEVLREGLIDFSAEFMFGEGADILRLTAAEQQILETDLAKARASLETELALKMDYWSRLPWVLVGVAHISEERARDCGRRALGMFEADPRQQAHHPKTWLLLCAGATFRMGLEQFLAGAPRWSCHPAFKLQVAAFRFSPSLKPRLNPDTTKSL